MTEKKRKIHIIGINSFEFQELPKKLQNLFLEIVNIAIPDSYFKDIRLWAERNTKDKKLLFASKSDRELINWLKSQETDVILISRGDPLWFGIGRILLENFPKDELFFYPSNTSAQIAFSKLKIPWQEASFVSIHGRDSIKLIETLKSKPSSLAILTDAKHKGLKIIQKNLIELKLKDAYEFWLCEDLGLKNEKIRKINVKDRLPSDISKLNIVILLKKDSTRAQKNIPLFGLKDDTFKTFEDRPNLLTKREIRVQILADLELPENGIILDIGAGCGSIGLEALKLRPNLNLLSIDKRIGSKELIAENAKRLGVNNLSIFEDDIDNLLTSNHAYSFRKASRVIIGGCNKNTKLRIINELSKNMLTGGIISIPLIDIQIIKHLKEALVENDFSVSLNLIQTYKSLSILDGLRLEPNNPVFLMKGKK